MSDLVFRLTFLTRVVPELQKFAPWGRRIKSRKFGDGSPKWGYGANTAKSQKLKIVRFANADC